MKSNQSNGGREMKSVRFFEAVKFFIKIMRNRAQITKFVKTKKIKRKMSLLTYRHFSIDYDTQ